MSRVDPFRFPVHVRYLEADQQGVVFNMWYLAYFDDAMTAFLEAGGLRYSTMLEAGFDVQLVHTELDWTGSLRWGEPAWVDVAVAQLGNTSFTLRFTVRGGYEEREPVASGATVYVVVATDGSGKRPIPPLLLEALEPVV
jgi:acyl-CoA thioester hydrolase